MKKQRVMLFSGFLGSGKTTIMVATAKYLKEKGIKAALITNDLGSNLVDTNFAQLEGVPVTEIPDGCLCHAVDHFVETLKALSDRENPDIILAEPVGSCVDLVRNVYADMERRYADSYELAPFTSVVDPIRYQAIYMEKLRNTFDPKATYMFKKQLEEADTLLLNKTDLLTLCQQEEILSSLKKNFPSSTIIPVSAITQLNFDKWTSSFLQGQRSSIRELDIDWDYVMAGDRSMGWYNKILQVTQTTGLELDFNDFCRALIEQIKKEFENTNQEIAHLKLICSYGQDYCKAALTSVLGTPSFSRRFTLPHPSARLNINVRVLALPDELTSIMETALEKTARQYHLELREQKTQSFDSFQPAPIPVYVP